MHIYEIVNCNGEVIEYVKANTEKQALCIYIANHEELVDIMLWKSTANGMWRLAEYDNEENFMFARFSHNI